MGQELGLVLFVGSVRVKFDTPDTPMYTHSQVWFLPYPFPKKELKLSRVAQRVVDGVYGVFFPGNFPVFKIKGPITIHPF